MKNDADLTHSKRRRVYFVLPLTFFALTLLVFFAGNVTAEKTVEAAAATPVCRFGTSTGRVADNPYLEEMGVGWIVDFWATSTRPLPAGVDYSPMIRMKQDQVNGVRLDTYTMRTPSISSLVGNHPGALWLVGNEVDRVFVQDDMMPDAYARAYHDLYHEIKALDPTALVANSGLVSVSPGRLQYLDLVWESYKDQFGVEMPVDVWNMHVYILGEKIYPSGKPQVAWIALGTNPDLALWYSNFDASLCNRSDVICWEDHDDADLFWGQVEAMRSWMKQNGQQDKPLILSEWSILLDKEIDDEYGERFGKLRVIDYLNNTVEMMENRTDPNLGYPQDDYRLVQQWLWYHMNDGAEGTPNPLVNLDGSGNPYELTTIGLAYKDQIADVDARPNLAFTAVYDAVIANSSSATLTAEIINNGNTTATGPFKVSFYEDAQFLNLIGEVTVPAGFSGCAQERVRVSVNWDGLAPDVDENFWVVVDSGAVVNEIDEGDNISSADVWVDPPVQLFVPLIGE
jgi:hypothetical protein